MAIYEYECNHGCGEFEVEKSIADIVDVECPVCGVISKHRLISTSQHVYGSHIHADKVRYKESAKTPFHEKK